MQTVANAPAPEIRAHLPSKTKRPNARNPLPVFGPVPPDFALDGQPLDKLIKWHRAAMQAVDALPGGEDITPAMTITNKLFDAIKRKKVSDVGSVIAQMSAVIDRLKLMGNEDSIEEELSIADFRALLGNLKDAAAANRSLVALGKEFDERVSQSFRYKNVKPKNRKEAAAMDEHAMSAFPNDECFFEIGRSKAKTTGDFFVKARAVAMANFDLWEKPFDDLDWGPKNLRMMVESIFEAAGGPAVEQYLNIAKASKTLPVSGS